MKTLHAGAVQMASQHGQVRANLERALPLVKKAASEGAQIILLPELMPTGYACNAEMWDGGEPRQGLTVQWLRKHAKARTGRLARIRLRGVNKGVIGIWVRCEEEIISSFAGEPTLNSDGRTLYFVHHYFSSDLSQMIEADIYVSTRIEP
jgi:hypothetical protein